MARKLDLSCVKVAAFDLDGTTLLDGTISPAVRSALKTLSEKGIAIAVTTARDISQIPKAVLEVFDYRITANGACVTDRNGNVIFQKYFEKESAHRALDILKKNNGSSALYFNGMVMATPGFLIRLLKRTNYLSKKTRKSANESGNNKLSFTPKHYLKKTKGNVYRFQTYFPSKDDQSKAKDELLEAGANPITLEDLSMETTVEGVTKAQGMIILCSHLGCSEANAIAFGDSANDLDLMRTCGYSVGMGNAEECVKLEADYITDPVTEDGVATAIKILFSL